MPHPPEPDPDSEHRPETLDATQRVAPTRTEPLAAAASMPIGGPLGEHAAVGRHWFWSPLRIGLLLGALALTLGWFGKAGCIQQYIDANGSPQLDWRSDTAYVKMCYSDIVPLYGAEKLNKPDTFPYATSWVDKEGTPQEQVRYMEYPVLTGMFQWVNAKITHAWLDIASTGWLPGAIPVAIYFNISAFWLALAWLVTVWAVRKSAGRRPWDAVLVAISPLAIVHAFTNFDTLATAFAATGLLAWARRKPVLAGVLLGLGAAAKLYPLFLLGPLLVLCIRTGKMRAWGLATATTFGTWALVNLPFAYWLTDGWREFFRLNRERGMDPDSLYNVISYFTGWSGFDGKLGPDEAPTILNTVSGVLFLVLCAGVAYIALSAPVRPRVAQLGFLVVAAFLLTNKVWSPQYSLWLVPLAALAIPRWRLVLGWMLIDALVWAPRMFYYLGTDDRGLPPGWFLGTVIVRDLMVLAICVVIIREIYRPHRDLVRQAGDDDPLGGFLDRAPDVRVLPGIRTLPGFRKLRLRRKPPDDPPTTVIPALGATTDQREDGRT